MKIEKLTLTEKTLIERTLKVYLKAWQELPEDIDAENLNIERIRYIPQWGHKTAPEDGYIVEFATEKDRYREVLGRSELGLSIAEFKKELVEQEKNGVSFGKLFVAHQTWHKYPIVDGELDSFFDKEADYREEGIFGGLAYRMFNKRGES